MQDLAGIFRAQQDESNLGTIAMGDHNIPALGNHLGNVRGRLAHGRKLVGHALMSIVFD
jgi:hypothetical protein